MNVFFNIRCSLKSQVAKDDHDRMDENEEIVHLEDMDEMEEQEVEQGSNAEEDNIDM